MSVDTSNNSGGVRKPGLFSEKSESQIVYEQSIRDISKTNSSNYPFSGSLIRGILRCHAQF